MMDTTLGEIPGMIGSRVAEAFSGLEDPSAMTIGDVGVILGVAFVALMILGIIGSAR